MSTNVSIENAWYLPNKLSKSSVKKEILDEKLNVGKNDRVVIFYYKWNEYDYIYSLPLTDAVTVRDVLKIMNKGLNLKLKSNNFKSFNEAYWNKTLKKKYVSVPSSTTVVYWLISRWLRSSDRISLVNKFEEGNLTLRELFVDRYLESISKKGKIWHLGIGS